MAAPRRVHKRKIAAPAESEASFMAAVIALATLHKWKCYHTYDSRCSEAGYPDLTLVRDGRLLMVELKTNTGRLRAAQRAWLAALASVPGIEVAVWRPAMWDEIERALA